MAADQAFCGHGCHWARLSPAGRAYDFKTLTRMSRGAFILRLRPEGPEQPRCPGRFVIAGCAAARLLASLLACGGAHGNAVAPTGHHLPFGAFASAPRHGTKPLAFNDA